MMYTVIARNIKTEEEITISIFDTMAEAEYAIKNEIEWDEDDIPEEWEFRIEEDIDLAEYEPDYDECGFDPYEGCYTYDC